MAKEKKKKKSFLRRLLGFLFVLIFIVAVGAGVFLYFVYDDSVDSYEYDEDYTAEELKNDLLYNGFKDVKDTGILSFSIDQKMLNSLLHESFSSVKESTNGILENAYVLIDGASYQFNFRFKYLFVETKLVIDATLKEDVSDDRVVFELNSFKAGKITATGLVDLVKGQIDDATVENVFASVGLSIKSDMANKRLTYAYSDIYSDLRALLKGEATLSDFVSIIDLVEENSLFSFANDDDGCALNLDLTDFTYNPSFTSKKSLTYPMETLNSQCEALLGSRAINADDLPLAFEYLMFGYGGLTDEEKAAIVS